MPCRFPTIRMSWVCRRHRLPVVVTVFERVICEPAPVPVPGAMVIEDRVPALLLMPVPTVIMSP